LPNGERARSIPYELAYPFVALWQKKRTQLSGFQSGDQSATE